MASFVGIYARALADVVIDRKIDANRVTADLSSLETFLQESADLRTIWDTPSVAGEQKLKLLDAFAVLHLGHVEVALRIHIHVVHHIEFAGRDAIASE